MSENERRGRKPLPIPEGLADLIASGSSVRDVAKQHGVSFSTVHTWLRKSGIGMKPGALLRCDHSAVLADRAAGMTLCAVAKKHGISFQRVAQIVTKPSSKPMPEPTQSRNVLLERKIRGRELDTAVLAEWNKAKLTMREIGAIYGVPRNSVARSLHSARLRGEYVLAIDPATHKMRQQRFTRRDKLVQQAALIRAAKAAKRAAAQSPDGVDSVSGAVLTAAAWPAWNGEFITIGDLMTVVKL